MTCKHTPKFSFKLLIARKPELICRRCGVALEMTSSTYTVNRVLNGLLIAAMVFKVFKGTTGKASLVTMALDIGVLLLYVLIYVVAYFLMLQFGQYTEKIEETPEIPEGSDVSSQKPDAASLTGTTGEAGAAAGEKPQYTQEQLDLMELYKSYAKDEPAGEAGSAQAGSQPAAKSQLATGAQLHTEEECVHELAKSWKNYIPTNFNFFCAKCGQPITLTKQTKKNMNIAMMAVVLVILMPTFMNNSVNTLEYGLLTLLAFAVAGLIQFIYLRKARFEIREVEVKKSRK